VSGRLQSISPQQRELVPPGWSQRNSQKTEIFVTEKQATSIAITWSDPVSGRELHPLKSSAAHGALLRQLHTLSSVGPLLQDGRSQIAVGF
jgi:hypothetical protein